MTGLPALTGCARAAVAWLRWRSFLPRYSWCLAPECKALSLRACILAGGAGALYVSQSSFWSVSADIAGRSSGVFSSMVNMGAQVGGAVTASLTPWVAQRFGWTTSFRHRRRAGSGGRCSLDDRASGAPAVKILAYFCGAVVDGWRLGCGCADTDAGWHRVRCGRRAAADDGLLRA